MVYSHQLKMGLKVASPIRPKLHLAQLIWGPAYMVPTRCDWLAGIPVWPLFKNGEIGDCVLASACRQILAWMLATGRSDNEPTDEDCVAAYSAATALEGAAYDPRTGANDNGCYDDDAMRVWESQGIRSHKILGWVHLDPWNADQIRYAIATFGGIRVALNLPELARVQYDKGCDWGEICRCEGDPAPGSWGAHQVWVGAYDSRFLTCVPWDRPQCMSYRFLARFGIEASAAISDDFLRASGQTPSGLNMAEMRKRLAELGLVA